MLPIFRTPVASVVLVVATLFAAVSGARAQDLRFSVSLSVADRTAAGLNKFSSDQVAVIDALVRRDTATRGAKATSTEPEKANATFSQRLTAEERRTAGLALLSPEELSRLDAFVDRQQSARLARALLAPPSYVARNSRLTPTEKKKEREVHGSFSLSYGMGSGGYSEKSGSMVLTMEDPDKHYLISVGYSETHVKGGNYIYRDPLYDGTRTLLPDEPFRP